MKATILASLALAAAALGASAEDCAACKPGKECPTHETADDAAIKEATPLLRDKDLEKRREGIDRLAAAGGKHLNARSKKLTGELARMMADPEATVKGYAAEKLGEVGEEASAAAALSQESAKQEKLISTDKPAKDAELKKWESDTRVLESMYTGLGKLPAQPVAAAAFDRGIRATSPWVVKAAAANCHAFKKNKVVAKALVEVLAHLFTIPSTEGNAAAWVAVSQALPDVTGCNDIPTQKDGNDAARWNADWQKWWRANEKSMK